MEVPFTPGNTAFVINVISDVLAIVSVLALVRSLNAIGRWKLYRSGKVDMNMHFHDIGFVSALWNAFHVRKVFPTVSALLFFQATVLVINLVLITTAPIGLSESNSFRVSRNHTVPGDSLCRTKGFSNSAHSRLGEASERVKLHFESGGNVLSVGRTGRNADALIVEDEQFSLGSTVVVDEFNVSIPMNISISSVHPRLEYDDASLHARPDLMWSYDFSVENWTISGIDKQIVKGPLYIMYSESDGGNDPYEGYTFARCTLPRLELQIDESKEFISDCTAANLQRSDEIDEGWATLTENHLPLRDMVKTYQGLNMSELGKRSLMVFDVAKSLGRDSCGNSYVAYLPSSEISRTSVIIICALGGITLLNLVAAALSLLITRGTFNWNGSYQRVINLVSNSDSIEQKSCWKISSAPKVDVVVEPAHGHLDSTTYDVHAIPREAASNPVPKANVNSINKQ